ncbi:MAG: type II secretion system protein [Minisyncoccia bacterium]
MHKNRSQGFTLIELLVVIAIIGILSAVVLASLNTARSKGNDAAIQSNLSTIQTQAEIFYGIGNTYTGVCSDATVAKAIVGTEVANGAGAVVCNANATKYAVSSGLSSNAARFWCVDSTGGSSNSTTALAALFECPPSN